MARDGRPDRREQAVRTAEGFIECQCGDRLADSITGDTVVIDGVEFQFRRRNDVIECRSCGVMHPVRRFRADAKPTAGTGVPVDTGLRRRSEDRG